MKLYLLLFFWFSAQTLNAQTNTFPPSGNVGVGTSTPVEKLEVMGQINSYNVWIGNRTLHASSRNFANFGSNGHGSLLISSNLYIDGCVYDDRRQWKCRHPYFNSSGDVGKMPVNALIFEFSMS